MHRFTIIFLFFVRPEEISLKSEVSVYDIKDHPYYKYRPGYAVIRVDGADVSS